MLIVNGRSRGLRSRWLRVVVGAALLALGSGATATGRDADSFKAGGAAITISRDDLRPVEGASRPVKCNAPRTQIVIPYEDGFSLDVDEATRRALSKELGIERANGWERELRNALLAKSTAFAGQKLMERTPDTVDVVPEPCFDKIVIPRYRRHRYSVNPSWVSRGWFQDELRDFNWVENAGAEYLIEARYDEACAPTCAIAGKKRPVEGRDGERLLVRVRPDASTSYIVPLYYDGQGRIIDILPLLPPAAQSVAGAGPGVELSHVALR